MQLNGINQITRTTADAEGLEATLRPLVNPRVRAVRS